MGELERFVAESNRIEGITTVLPREIQAHERFLALESPGPRDLEVFVWTINPPPQPHALRREEGMNVRVGRHIAPSGGAEIERAIHRLMRDAIEKAQDPYRIHCRYETLHPFMDGNGRSGRLLWAWQMTHQRGEGISLGFLHRFYYQTLEHSRP
jgi:hypothetical protein